MNINAKTLNCILWKDLKVSQDLTDFVENMIENESLISKVFIADMLEELRDQDDEDVSPSMINELKQVAKLMKDKQINYFIINSEGTPSRIN